MRGYDRQKPEPTKKSGYIGNRTTMALHLNSNTVRKSFMHGMGLACVLSLTACGGGGGGGGFNLVTSTEPEPVKLTGCADTDSCASNPDLQIGGERPAQAQIPSNYTTTTRYPLLILLHGFGASGALQSAYLGLNTRVDQKQYVLVIPDGTENITGARFGVLCIPGGGSHCG